MVLYNISIYSQYTQVLLDLSCVTLLQISRQKAQIEHYSYADLRVLCLAYDERGCIFTLDEHYVTVQCVVLKVKPRPALGTQTETV